MPGMTLDQLEGVVWGEPTSNSYLVTTCHRLRTKPVDEFTVEDLRIMIGQKIGLSHLVPLAVAAVERDPLAEGDYYPGDLLANLIGSVDWLKANPEWLVRVIRVAERAKGELGEQGTDLKQRLAEFLLLVRG
jgi:CDI immunity proteins